MEPKSETRKAFERMMLNGRLNELMSQGIQEGIAETEKAHRGFVRPVYFTPKDKTPRPHLTEAEVDAEFAIPPEVLQAALASPALLRVPISYQGEGLILTGETTPPAQELISVTESVITVQQKFERQVQQPLLVEENALTTKSPP